MTGPETLNEDETTGTEPVLMFVVENGAIVEKMLDPEMLQFRGHFATRAEAAKLLPRKADEEPAAALPEQAEVDEVPDEQETPPKAKLYRLTVRAHKVCPKSGWVARINADGSRDFLTATEDGRSRAGSGNVHFDLGPGFYEADEVTSSTHSETHRFFVEVDEAFEGHKVKRSAHPALKALDEAKAASLQAHPMFGSEKQIDWALTIRQGKVDALSGLRTRLETRGAECPFNLDEAFGAAEKALWSVGDSHWWITHRDSDVFRLLEILAEAYPVDTKWLMGSPPKKPNRLPGDFTSIIAPWKPLAEFCLAHDAQVKARAKEESEARIAHDVEQIPMFFTRRGEVVEVMGSRAWIEATPRQPGYYATRDEALAALGLKFVDRLEVDEEPAPVLPGKPETPEPTTWDQIKAFRRTLFASTEEPAPAQPSVVPTFTALEGKPLNPVDKGLGSIFAKMTDEKIAEIRESIIARGSDHIIQLGKVDDDTVIVHGKEYYDIIAKLWDEGIHQATNGRQIAPNLIWVHQDHTSGKAAIRELGDKVVCLQVTAHTLTEEQEDQGIRARLKLDEADGIFRSAPWLAEEFGCSVARINRIRNGMEDNKVSKVPVEYTLREVWPNGKKKGQHKTIANPNHGKKKERIESGKPGSATTEQKAVTRNARNAAKSSGGAPAPTGKKLGPIEGFKFKRKSNWLLSHVGSTDPQTPASYKPEILEEPFYLEDSNQWYAVTPGGKVKIDGPFKDDRGRWTMTPPEPGKYKPFKRKSGIAPYDFWVWFNPDGTHAHSKQKEQYEQDETLGLTASEPWQLVNPPAPPEPGKPFVRNGHWHNADGSFASKVQGESYQAALAVLPGDPVENPPEPVTPVTEVTPKPSGGLSVDEFLRRISEDDTPAPEVPGEIGKAVRLDEGKPDPGTDDDDDDEANPYGPLGQSFEIAARHRRSKIKTLDEFIKVCRDIAPERLWRHWGAFFRELSSELGSTEDIHEADKKELDEAKAAFGIAPEPAPTESPVILKMP